MCGIPIIFVCGTEQRTKSLGQHRFCPNCGNKEGAELFEQYGKFQFCFIPLCRTGGSSRFYRCRCGATYPAQQG